MIRRNFVDSGNLQLIRDGMHQGVAACNWNGGTSYYVCDRRIDAAGKTGTAEVQGQAPHAWWIGFAPYNHPKISVAVLIPSANSEGAYAAAPLAHKIFEDYFHLTPQLPDRPGDTNWLDDESAQLVGSGGAQ
jgi:cell division protein FtsI/penicillin-binding protein 2